VFLAKPKKISFMVKGKICFFCFLFFLHLINAFAVEPPVSKNKSEVYSKTTRNITACGLIETTWDDPDWVMVSSDYILRSHDCIAECADEHSTDWYDQPFDPCYNGNRYWKFQENSGTAFAFSMSALEVGSFDSLYLRRKVKFQLYTGTDENNPFGPLMIGPKYISIDYWRDIAAACEGFEPDTFFVTGSQGALSNYSIKIGGDTVIKDIDIKKSDNMTNHHTDTFKDHFVLRRSSAFEMNVKLGEEYGEKCHEIYFRAYSEFNGVKNTIDIPYYEYQPSKNDWGAEFIRAITNNDNTKTVTLKIYIPANASIGSYDIKAFVRNKNIEEPTDEKEFDKPLIILFNPWSSDDEVYRSTGLDEYILNENGYIWRGESTNYSKKSWRFNQFNKNTLAAALKLLDSISPSDRSNPKLVSRHFTKVVNSNDDNGVLVGKWSGNYSGGYSPSHWSGSDQIIKLYLSSNNPVKYGQCWVFGGLLTSFLRCLGIPTRPITNFNSAHDKDKPLNKTIDWYYDAKGKDRNKSKDAIWNYHVWCDVWISNVWHAVDATPQEASNNFYQMGPAPLQSIKNNSGGLYDVDFVFSEVDADIKKYYMKSGASEYTLVETNTDYVGITITTKDISSSSVSIITSEYKNSRKKTIRTKKSETINLSDLKAIINIPESIVIGNEIVWSVKLTNNASSIRTAMILIKGSAVSYNGTFISDIESIDKQITIAPGKSNTISLIVPPSSYLDWTSVTRTFESTIIINVIETEKVYIDSKITNLIHTKPSLFLNTEEPTTTGSLTDLTLEWDNPLSEDLDNLRVIFAVGEGLRIRDAQEYEILVGKIVENAQLSLNETVKAILPGNYLISASISSDELNDVSATIEVEVLEDCNSNGIKDIKDINSGMSKDCNENNIPDECEKDCNNNGIPDDCDVLLDPAIDCNANGVPDSCDLSSETSQDINSNSIPDECDTDCNKNSIPDDTDILNYESSDYNKNGIPDECDEDCNENGISDELDITLGDFADTNKNGVPDVCEDYDGDGVFNIDDDCPYDSKKTEPGECGCGVVSCKTSGEDDSSSTCFISTILF